MLGQRRGPRQPHGLLTPVKSKLPTVAAMRARLVAGWCWLQRHLAPRSVTPTGWALLVGGLAAAALGWGRGWLEFRALAVMALAVLLVAGLSVLRRRQHDVKLELHRPRVQAGEPALGRVAVRAEGGRASGAITMELPVGKAVASFRVGSLGPDDEHEELFSIPTRRRGIVALGPVRSVQADPIGAISRQKALTEQIELYIHPRTVAVEAGIVGVLQDVEGVATTNLSSSDVSFHALREYVPGDDRRAVHWRTTARTGKLMVRQFEETRRAHLLLLLSTLAADYGSDDAFEQAVSSAASLGVAALRADRQVTVLTSTGQLRFPSVLGLLDRFSGIELSEKGRGLRELAAASGGLSGVSVAVLIAGQPPVPALRAAQLALPPGVRAFAIRCAAERLARRRAGGLVVLEVPTLDDLPVAVGRAL